MLLTARPTILALCSINRYSVENGGGISFGLGVGSPIDINISASVTETKYQTNIIDSLKNIFHR